MGEGEASGIRGFDSRDPDDGDTFQGALALALFQTEGQQKVYLLVPKAQQEKIFRWLKLVARQLIRARRDNAEHVEAIRDLFRYLIMQSRVLQFPDEPPRWVSIGFCSTDPLPEWMKGRLLPS